MVGSCQRAARLLAVIWSYMKDRPWNVMSEEEYVGWHTNVRNHLHPLMKRRTSWNNENPLDWRAGWVADLGPWSRSSNRVSRGLKPWGGVGESGAAHRFPARIRSHM